MAGNGYVAHGPIGTGPYFYVDYEAINFTNHLEKYGDYWNGQNLMAKGLFGIQQCEVTWIDTSYNALLALEAGDVDVLDSQYHLNYWLNSIENSWGDWITYDAFGVQELGVNMLHPILGTGVDTPLGQQNPSRAAEAARYVRQAISHLIPRQMIIDTILDGFANPGVTTAITTQTAGYDPSLQPYSYDVGLAKSLLEAAGYDPAFMIPEISSTLLFTATAIFGGIMILLGKMKGKKKENLRNECNRNRDCCGRRRTAR